MVNLNLYPHQLEALRELDNGKILRGGVGSGKSRVAVLYFYTREANGRVKINDKGESKHPSSPKDLYIITTAKKRDSLEWEKELADVGLTTHEDPDQQIRITIDSWHNIQKYKEVKDAFFIFDEQKLVGYGTWSKTFLSIAKSNRWIVLSATPGDIWMDYLAIFIANGHYKNKTDFTRNHVVYTTYAGYPKIDRYINTNRLFNLRSDIIVDMPYMRHTIRHEKLTLTVYDKDLYKRVEKDRWNYLEEKPIEDAAEMFGLMRRIVNSDPSRAEKLLSILHQHPRLVIFYNFNYELDILRNFAISNGVSVSEWNGHKHEEIPKSSSWIYLVQYTAGAEGWNCVETDTMVFYSLNYSYKIMEQARGRIDRLNTPYTDLYYYTLRSTASIDQMIMKALRAKRNFNESVFKW